MGAGYQVNKLFCIFSSIFMLIYYAETRDSAGLQHEVRELKNQLRQARQEKNLLEFKNELLLDMVQILFIHELILIYFSLH